MTEIPKDTGDQPVDLTEVGRDLSYAIEDARQKLEQMIAEYGQLPREVLTTLGWRGIAWYHGVDGVTTRMMHGVDSPEDKRMERIKDQRLAALTEEERQRAIAEANDWLDENFDD